MPINLKLIVPIIVAVVVIALVFILFPPTGGPGQEQTVTVTETPSPTPSPTPPTHQQERLYYISMRDIRLRDPGEHEKLANPNLYKVIEVVFEYRKTSLEVEVIITNIAVRELNNRNINTEQITVATSIRRRQFNIGLTQQEYDELFGDSPMQSITFIFTIRVDNTIVREELFGTIMTTETPTTRPGPGPILD